MQKIPHIPVLLNEVLEVFSPIKEGIIIDCTLGFGGHTRALLQQNPNIKIIGIDRDKDARTFSKNFLKDFKDRFECFEGSFGDGIKDLIQKYGTQIKGILADIGVSSFQLDTSHRGFGFNSEVLDMRMDCHNDLDARSILKNYSANSLEKIFRDYGELRESKKLASLIVQERKKQDFESARDFSIFLQRHFRNPKILPLVYQALRIEVNKELEELQKLLHHSSFLSNVVLCIITFHSLEDRIVKQAFNHFSKSCICPKDNLKCTCGNNHQQGVLLTKKPKVASKEEIKHNSRSKSAKLRAFLFNDNTI
ncbi:MULTISPECIES: 16S rRNA (cytosine(1402)-N(4))-methyltransferase RsmH [unclassified Helicobacter]|uniref:16S rRNA (cytosine(1402)-N(4))-methyltransferase RsmH n=1 Tax=unclassified Helicobacter TaxID=2593540 RepID=UPI000CF140BC|nr:MULTISPECIES: 16S rRNA (cytosine(1402)-N(4))-methyltransferase RsmH [unclassified Helicobacter]